MQIFIEELKCLTLFSFTFPQDVLSSVPVVVAVHTCNLSSSKARFCVELWVMLSLLLAVTQHREKELSSPSRVFLS